MLIAYQCLGPVRNLLHVFFRLLASFHKVLVRGGHSVDDTLATARQLQFDVPFLFRMAAAKRNGSRPRL
jgi:hypothetical protein